MTVQNLIDAFLENPDILELPICLVDELKNAYPIHELEEMLLVDGGDEDRMTEVVAVRFHIATNISKLDI